MLSSPCKYSKNHAIKVSVWFAHGQFSIQNSCLPPQESDTKPRNKYLSLEKVRSPLNFSLTFCKNIHQLLGRAIWLKIIIVNHGYPQRYNAGSEIYAQTLAHGLLHQGHKVTVFSRKEDSSRPDYEIEIDEDSEEPEIKLHLVNMANSRDRYRHNEVDARFRELLEQFRPDVVHVGHLNHLSTGIVHVASSLGIPTVFTLHDYWLMCPRGQFVQTNSGGDESWKLCDGQEDYKCAVSCYSRHFSGLEQDLERDKSYWTSWIGSRMAEIREISDLVDLFIAPSEYLRERFSNEFASRARKSSIWTTASTTSV